MSAVTTARARRVTNDSVELGRYTISAGERVIYGQRVPGVVRLVDDAARGRGRRYVIERELTVMAELEAIVADYLERATIRDTIPAAGAGYLLADCSSATDDRLVVGSARAPAAQRAGLGDRRAGRPLHRTAGARPNPVRHDLLAAAAEFGDTAVDVLRIVLATTRPCASTATPRNLLDDTGGSTDV